MSEKRKAVNIWNNIERVWAEQVNFIYEGQTMVGIHGIDDEDVIDYLNWLCKKIQSYKKEMELYYGESELTANSMMLTHIYLFYDEHTGLYKIGRSIDPNYREKTLLPQAPKVRKIFISPIADKKIEKELHRKFKSKRIRGEWFELDESDINYIKSYNYGT